MGHPIPPNSENKLKERSVKDKHVEKNLTF